MGQPAPPFSHAPAELLPLAFKAIPVHVDLPLFLVHAVKKRRLVTLSVAKSSAQ
jgi:hypothetical protein